MQLSDLGSTLDGRDLNLLTIGHEVSSDLKVWIIARQHPGETMAEWFIEGLLGRLLDTHDPLARALMDKATFYVVPNMNPDGSVRGNLRTNAAGANLNREWLEPSAERSPEVLWVREKCRKPGWICSWISTATKACLISLSPALRACPATARAWRRWKPPSSSTSCWPARIFRMNTATPRMRLAKPI